MAVWIRGMNRAELAALTEVDALLRKKSSTIPRSRQEVDKHSTGGIGDKTSLILAPVVAAGGLIGSDDQRPRPRSHRGTLDKLEAIPGFM